MSLTAVLQMTNLVEFAYKLIFWSQQSADNNKLIKKCKQTADKIVNEQLITEIKMYFERIGKR